MVGYATFPEAPPGPNGGLPKEKSPARAYARVINAFFGKYD